LLFLDFDRFFFFLLLEEVEAGPSGVTAEVSA
jgi:hypothetical protein